MAITACDFRAGFGLDDEVRCSDKLSLNYGVDPRVSISDWQVEGIDCRVRGFDGRAGVFDARVDDPDSGVGRVDLRVKGVD